MLIHSIINNDFYCFLNNPKSLNQLVKLIELTSKRKGLTNFTVFSQIG